MIDGNYVEETYRYLHGIPEPGLEEHRTSMFIADELDKFGFSVTSGIGGTGIVAKLDSGNSGINLGIRADMDALQFEIDGKKSNIHACGHDANSSMVLSMAKDIAKNGISRGALYVIFQPAEESLKGAELIIESGKIDNLDELAGIHLRPAEEARLGEATPALYHGACHRINVRIKGCAAHSARPHLGVNAITACNLVINAVNAVRCDPRVPYSANVTQIMSGTAPNIIPDRAEMTIDLRAQNNRLMEGLVKKVRKSASEAVKPLGAKIELEDAESITAAEYDEGLIEIARRAVTKVLGSSLEPVFTAGSEDFHLYTKKLSIRTTYIGLGADLTPGLHNPEMSFELSALSHGREILKEFVALRLG